MGGHVRSQAMTAPAAARIERGRTNPAITKTGALSTANLNEHVTRVGAEGPDPLYGAAARLPTSAGCHIFIDNCPLFTLLTECPLVRGTSTGDGRLMERVRFLRAGLVTPFSGGSGIDPPALRPGRGVLRLSAIDGAGNARVLSLA